jgi:hypothetical protein
MTQIEQQLWESGYQKGNLTICGGQEWTPKQSGVPEPKDFMEHIVLQPCFPPIAIVRGWIEYKTVAIFETVEQMQNWLKEFGKISGPGIRVDQGVWD